MFEMEESECDTGKNSEVKEVEESRKGKGTRKRKGDGSNGPATKRKGSRTGMFTFILPAVVRILWFMLSESALSISSEVDKKFYRIWFQNIVHAAGKVCRLIDGKNGATILFSENIQEEWDYNNDDPPNHVYCSLRSIKTRQLDKASPLPGNLDVHDMLQAAWYHSTCDVPGFLYEPTFKVHQPIQNVCVDSSPVEIQNIVATAQVCATCWGCTCGAAQSLTWKCARQQTTITDLGNEKDEALSLCGYQEQLTAEHWDHSIVEVVKRCTSIKRSMITMQQQLEKRDNLITSLKEDAEHTKTEMEVMKSDSRRKESLEERVTVLLEEKLKLQDRVECLQAKEEALKIALEKISAMTAVVKGCQKCKRKCGGFGIVVED